MFVTILLTHAHTLKRNLQNKYSEDVICCSVLWSMTPFLGLENAFAVKSYHR